MIIILLLIRKRVDFRVDLFLVILYNSIVIEVKEFILKKSLFVLLFVSIVSSLFSTGEKQSVLGEMLQPDENIVHADYMTFENHMILKVPLEYRDFVIDWDYDFPVEYFIAIGFVETNWNNNKGSVNRNGSTDIGVMQLNNVYLDYYEDYFNVDDCDPYNANENMAMSALILEDLLVRMKTIEGAVKSYNVGPTAYVQDTKVDLARLYWNKVNNVIQHEFVNYNFGGENVSGYY